MSPSRSGAPLNPAAALAYFQHLASGGLTNPPAIPLESIAFSTDGVFLVNGLPAMRLQQALLHGSTLGTSALSYFQGAVWIEGVAQRVGYEVPFRCPVLFRPVNVRVIEVGLGTENRLNVSNSSIKRNRWRLTPGLFPESVANEHLVDLLPPPGLLFPRAMDKIRTAARQALAEAFEPDEQVKILDEGFGLWAGSEPSSSALQEWTGKEAHSTALAHMYQSEPPRTGSRESDSEVLHCPLPLNAQQAEIVQQATSEPLVVVSGPPGTGKTHLVAAVALQQFGEGRSTLIATASEAAADSIEEMLARFPMVTAIRFGASVQPQILGNQLAEGVPDGESQFNIGWTSTELDRLKNEIDQVSAELRRRLRATEVNEGVIALRRTLPDWAADAPNAAEVTRWQELSNQVRAANRGRKVWALLKLRRAMAAPLTTKLSDLHQIIDTLDRIVASETPAGDVPSSQLWQQLERVTERHRVAAANHLEALRRADNSIEARRTLGQLATGLRHAHAVDRLAALAPQSDAFTKTVPLWFGTLQDLDTALPPKAGLFDLVIFDEASQASQIHGVSALMRAERALVIGDPRQMRHTPVSTAGQRQAAAAASRIGSEAATQVDEGAVSLFDAAAQQAPVTRLAEHFRCAPHIIGFCNEHFYNDRLRLMTQHPGRESRDAIHVVRPTGDEARAVVAEIHKLAGFGTRNIGVVAGHDAHAVTLRTAVSEGVSLRDQKRLSLRIGTPREFQGIERDSILLSPGIDADNLDLLDELQDPNTFNVVASRAQNDVYVVTALTAEELPAGLLRDYLDWSHLPPDPLTSDTSATGWKGDLALELSALGDIRVIVDYPVGGHHVDLAIGEGRLAFGVETSMHSDGIEAHVERHLALRRAGWHMLDAFETDWVGRQSECVAWLAAQWAQR